MSGAEFLIASHTDIGPAVTWLAKRLRISVTALAGQGRAENKNRAGNSSLVGIATGSRIPADLSLGPLLRILAPVRYEFFVRSIDKHGAVVQRKNSLPLRITGADGGRIDITITSVPEVGVALNTVALANDAAVTALIRRTGNQSTSLTSLATGAASAQSDVRVNPLLRLLASAGFEAGIRPVHASARAARMAFAQAARQD